MVKTGFFEETPGEKSSTRLSIFIILINGLLILDSIVCCGLYVFLKSLGVNISLLGVCTAATTIFAATIIPLITWKQLSKAQEAKNSETESETGPVETKL